MSIRRILLASLSLIATAAAVVAVPVAWAGAHIVDAALAMARLMVGPPTVVGREWEPAPRATDPNDHAVTSRSAFVDQMQRAGFTFRGNAGSRSRGVWLAASA